MSAVSWVTLYFAPKRLPMGSTSGVGIRFEHERQMDISAVM